MRTYNCINGFTKQKMIEVVEREFKGKATTGFLCRYLTEDGRKCAVGMFIPDGHLAQKYGGTARGLVNSYSDLEPLMPLDTEPLARFQQEHDNLSTSLPVDAQRTQLISWIEQNVI